MSFWFRILIFFSESAGNVLQYFHDDIVIFTHTNNFFKLLVEIVDAVESSIDIIVENLI